MAPSPINKHWYDRSWQIAVYLVKQYVADQCSRHAAALAYSTLLAIVPVLIVSFSVAAQFPIFHGVTEQLQKFMLDNFLAGSANTINQYLTKFIGQMSQLSWVTILSLTVVGILLLYNMVEAFNMIWHVKMHGRFQFTFIIYFIVLLCMPIIFGVLMLLVSALGSLSLLHSSGVMKYVNHPVVIVLPYILSFIAFTVFNWVLPSCQVKLRYAMIAGFIAMCLFELIKYGFSLYLQFFPTYRLIYGAMAVIPIFIVWVYITWLIVLVSAVICRGLQVRFREDAASVQV